MIVVSSARSDTIRRRPRVLAGSIRSRVRADRALALAAALAAMVSIAGCARDQRPSREFPLVGQVIAVAPDRNEVTITHEDIKNFMPGMTMPFKVKDPALLAGRAPGDLVTATLVVGEVEAYLSTLAKTGVAPLPASAEPPPAKTVQVGDIATDATLLDQAGDVRRLADWRGHRVAITFVYTRCPLPEFCPLMDRHFAAVQKQLASAAELNDVRLLSITIDPAFDTPPVLSAHARRLGANAAVWTFLSPEPSSMRAFFEQFGLVVEASGNGPGDITHNLRTLVLDAAGRITSLRTGNDWTPAQLVADLRATPAPSR